MTIEDARCPTDPAFWDMSRACPGTIETWPRSTILADFRMLTDKAKHYRRQSFGRSRDLPIRKVNQRAFTLLSHYLWLIGDMVDRHPELRDEHQKWLQPYPTFTSGWGAEVSLIAGRTGTIVRLRGINFVGLATSWEAQFKIRGMRHS